MEQRQPRTAASAGKRRLGAVFAITTTYMAVEVVAGLLSGSLALLADAGHMLTDVAGISLALLAISFAEQPATPERTYGYYRVEIMAALANALLLKSSPTSSLRWASSWPPSSYGRPAGHDADPLISAAIGLFILPRTWALLRETTGILLEGTPRGVDLADVREVVAKLDGIIDVHDLHIWALTSGVNAMSVHVVLEHIGAADDVRAAVPNAVERRFSVVHLTVQAEIQCCAEKETHP
jgi:cobalt-zinc-cadmium efflux system protein